MHVLGKKLLKTEAYRSVKYILRSKTVLPRWLTMLPQKGYQ